MTHLRSATPVDTTPKFMSSLSRQNKERNPPLEYIARGIAITVEKVAETDLAACCAPFRIIDIGNGDS